MEFKVTSISLGDIYLTDGSCNIRVLGEGLISPTKDSASFVVYLNSFIIVDGGENKRVASDELRDRIVDSIREYFAGKGMVVDFE
ncbi:Imm74 family immunity protein [Burkholderia guangdongensis]|uniref:Imm74 family immunity protein n=1 Tax=Burkholderia guangdongensis TaxID=1792500 RepID=UPI0015CCAD54|nr:Imm74 family immunity protein [Burkholderia guangdongensis]